MPQESAILVHYLAIKILVIRLREWSSKCQCWFRYKKYIYLIYIYFICEQLKQVYKHFRIVNFTIKLFRLCAEFIYVSKHNTKKNRFNSFVKTITIEA